MTVCGQVAAGCVRAFFADAETPFAMSSIPRLQSLPPFFIALVLVAFPALPAGAEENWNQFRGPDVSGHSTAPDVPEIWSADSVEWSVPLGGAGQSSPVNWGDRIFLTGASDDGTERYLFCLDRGDGELLWKKTVPCAAPEQTHKMNSHATPTCATDGEFVVAFFGPGGLHCYDLEGTEQWSLDLGEFPGVWGIGASPVLVDGLVIQNCDAEGPSRLVAVDIRSGKVVWDTPRKDKPRGGWSTPVPIEQEGLRELVLNGEFGVRGYDPVTGKEKWFCEGFRGRGTPVPAFARGRIFVVNGQPGDVYCVEPGGSGNVSETKRLWHAPRKGGRDLPSPAVVGDFLLVSSLSGIATCYDTASGDIHWTDRLGEGIQIAAAPLVANGLVYFQTVHGGDVIVVRPGEEKEIVAVNSLGAEADEVFRSTLAPIQGQLFVRSQSKLYCVE